MVAQLAETQCPHGRRKRARIKVSEEACNKPGTAVRSDLGREVLVTVVLPGVAHNRVRVIAALAGEMPATEVRERATAVQIVAEAETVSATAASPMAAALEVPAHSAEVLAVTAVAAHGAAARAAHPAWVHPAAVRGVAAVVGGGGECAMIEKEEHMRSQPSNVIAWSALVVLVAMLSCTLMMPLNAQTPPTEKAPAQPSSKAFDNPQQAAEALIQATASYDVPALLEIFGPDGKDFISSADPIRDKNSAETFSAKAREKNIVTIDPKDKTRAILSVGNKDWPLPVPIVKRKGKWYFDSIQGRDEILFRRIGANELDAIQICRGFVEAQQEYASEIHDDSGINQFAQKIISTPGKHDGLYWRDDDGTPGGPISEAIARAIEEGYSQKTSPYHGYYFKVLKGQGPAARFGQLDYVIEGAMIGGFALVAFPAEYRVTGVKTFMVGYDGAVYEKDFGPDTLTSAREMERYNPDKTWHLTNDQWPADALVASD
jgi:hypothetical protein